MDDSSNTTTSTPQSQETTETIQNPTPNSVFDTIVTPPPRGTSPYFHPAAVLHRPVQTYTSSPTDNPNLTLGNLTLYNLPYCLPWRPTAGPAEVQPDFSFISESCGGRAAIGVFGGGLMGLVMGVFLGAMSDMTPPVTVLNGKEVPQAPLKEQMRTTMRATAEKSLYWCRNFAFITGIFSGSECVVEKFRGKNDMWNSVAGGCVTGAAMQAKQGPQAMAMGCGGFAVFSIVIDKVMGTH